MPFSVKILRFFGILLLSLCALGVAGMTWAYLVEPNLLFVRKVDYRVPQWKGKGTPVKVVIAGDLHLMPTAFDEVRALRYIQRIMRLQPDLILLVGDYARGSSSLVTFKDGRQLQLSGILDTTRNVRKRLPKRQSPDIPHFLLSHRPETDHILSDGDVDIVISGHTHGGQVCLPFGLLRFEASPDHALPYTYPWHISGGNTYLITKGLGTSTLPLRFNCPPEIYLLELH